MQELAEDYIIYFREKAQIPHQIEIIAKIPKRQFGVSLWFSRMAECFYEKEPGARKTFPWGIHQLFRQRTGPLECSLCGEDIKASAKQSRRNKNWYSHDMDADRLKALLVPWENISKKERSMFQRRELPLYCGSCTLEIEHAAHDGDVF